MFTMKIQLGINCYVHNCYSNISAMLQEDSKKLKHSWLTPCSRIAVQLRISEKMLLHDAEEYVKQHIKTWRGKQILDNQPCMWFSHKICGGLQLYWVINRHFTSNLGMNHLDTEAGLFHYELLLYIMIMSNSCQCEIVWLSKQKRIYIYIYTPHNVHCLLQTTSNIFRFEMNICK
jgi:hypothetical protein